MQKYLSSLSDLGAAKALRGEESIVSDKNVKDLTLAIQTIDEFRPVIEEELKTSEKLSAWEKLEFHSVLYRAMLEFYLEIAKGNGIGDYEHIKDIALRNEMRFKDEFDAMYFIETFKGRLIRNIKKGFRIK